MTLNEINGLDDKYLVIKHEDLERYFSQFTKGIFSTDEEKVFIDNIPFNIVLEEISVDRKAHGKKDNRYVVLNLNDKIDIPYLTEQLVWIQSRILKVEDIATDLVNAIIKAEDKS